MKLRAIVLIEYDVIDGFLEAAEEENKLIRAVSKIVNGNANVSYHNYNIRPVIN